MMRLISETKMIMKMSLVRFISRTFANMLGL